MTSRMSTTTGERDVVEYSGTFVHCPTVSCTSSQLVSVCFRIAPSTNTKPNQCDSFAHFRTLCRGANQPYCAVNGEPNTRLNPANLVPFMSSTNRAAFRVSYKFVKVSAFLSASAMALSYILQPRSRAMKDITRRQLARVQVTRQLKRQIGMSQAAL
jgi:hypothetical protein